ncbi:hypothetical protein AYO21_08346 [Fonsecaea monophora]|uniref:Hemerythrin-like domain-containing protein n=1 Tax=Fonsecaea monophora TaxID=254056 RepID=A0A177F2F3_9EURO|nr:hypothetical protein AYO21_08346 [Fonsecaea monophora]KAH0843956.1 HHE domain-containing protein [Fonsecaea pedrosoi]OAG37492.1 hypothetical protein AYO21_08346 [Fonsecaea monophora]
MAAPSPSYSGHPSSDSSHHHDANSPNLPYDPPLTFSTVIEHDHNNINKFAGRLLRAKAPQDRARLLREVTWRLVRHDVSEDLVMRPAFIEHLGDEGVQMAEHDRTDHERARSELLALFHVPLEGDKFLVALRALFAELLEHMKIESGQQIPHLEHMLDPEESQRLGREYVKTQCLSPELEIVDKSTGARRRVWRDVEDFVRTDLHRFKEIWEELKLSEGPVDGQAQALHRRLDRGKL